MALRAVDQMALDEQVVDDKVIEAALEKRLRLREELAVARADSKAADDTATAAIARLELPMDGVARVGRFRISRTMTKGHSVSFDVDAKPRVSISLISDD